MTMPRTWFILFFLSCLSPALTDCSPPESPVKCSSPGNRNCTITNGYGAFPDRAICRADAVAYPASEAELVAIVAAATKNRAKIKAVTRFSHSIPKLVCPGDGDGNNRETILISTERLRRVVGVDVEAGTLTVQSGVSLRELIDAAAAAGLALPYAPYWWGVTVGGMLGTGAHGSSLWGRGSAVHDYVVALTMVSPGGAGDGFVRVWRLVDGDRDLDAARVSLGVLGVISQVTIKLEPMFKRSITYLRKSDSDLADEIASFGKDHEFADISWFPSQRKATYRLDNRVPPNTPGNGVYEFIPFRSTSSLALAFLRATEETQESLGDANGKCITARLITSTLSNSAYGLTNDGIIFTGYPVIGLHNRLQSSGTCLGSPRDAMLTACAWDPRIKGEFFHQTAFSIALPAAASFIRDVQALLRLEPLSLCGTELYNGFLLRYVSASRAHLGKSGPALDFDVTYFRNHNPRAPRLFAGVLDEIEQLATVKYGALPHWGKNRNVAFIGVAAKYPRLTEFLRAKERFDPAGLFSSEWSDQVLGLREGLEVSKEGCALEGLCICKEDAHCAPSKGYFCRPGRVFEGARVCRP